MSKKGSNPSPPEGVIKPPPPPAPPKKGINAVLTINGIEVKIMQGSIKHTEGHRD